MKTLIVYATKYGCTKKCAEILKSELRGEVTISSMKEGKVNTAAYDTIVIAGSVYMMKLQSVVIRFCKQHKDILLQKKLGIFICCYTPNGTEGFFEKFFPTELLRHASCVICVGGEMDYNKMNVVYRKMFQSLKKIDDFNKGFTEPQIQVDEIKKLAMALNNTTSA